MRNLFGKQNWWMKKSKSEESKVFTPALHGMHFFGDWCKLINAAAFGKGKNTCCRFGETTQNLGETTKTTAATSKCRHVCVLKILKN